MAGVTVGELAHCCLLQVKKFVGGAEPERAAVTGLAVIPEEHASTIWACSVFCMQPASERVIDHPGRRQIVMRATPLPKRRINGSANCGTLHAIGNESRCASCFMTDTESTEPVSIRECAISCPSSQAGSCRATTCASHQKAQARWLASITFMSGRITRRIEFLRPTGPRLHALPQPQRL
jgi:hypothetical protein